MVDEIIIDGVPYIAGKRAASLIGLSPDYISRWCREGFVDARRLAGGIWFVSTRSLQDYLAVREARRRAWREALRESRQDERDHSESQAHLT
jgi:hypothetical protein